MGIVRVGALSAEAPVVRVGPAQGWLELDLRELWEYRELLYFFIWRDIKVRYKQTILGAAWAVIQPVLTMLVFNFIFNGGITKVQTDSNIPYPIFSYTALLPWGLFTAALNNASRSLTANQNMVTKIYFPRLVLPLASVLSGLVDFAIAAVILVGMMFYFKITPNIASLWTLPFFLLLSIITALGVALWLSAINVQYRDVNYVLPFLTQFWLFITPVAYSAKVISGKWQLIYSLNPMAGVVNGFRWSLLGANTGPSPQMWISVAASVLVLVGGLFYFRNMEKTFADTI